MKKEGAIEVQQRTSLGARFMARRCWDRRDRARTGGRGRGRGHVYGCVDGMSVFVKTQDVELLSSRVEEAAGEFGRRGCYEHEAVDIRVANEALW